MKRKTVDRKPRLFRPKAFERRVIKVRLFTFGTSSYLFFVLVRYFELIKSGSAQGLIHLKGMRLYLALSYILVFQVKLIFVSFCRFTWMKQLSSPLAVVYFLSFALSLIGLKYQFLFQNHPT